MKYFCGLRVLSSPISQKLSEITGNNVSLVMDGTTAEQVP